MLPVLTVVGGLLDKLFGKIVADKDKNLEAQARINEQEVATSGTTRLKAWRGFVGWVCGVVFACLVLVFPIILAIFPNARLPDFTPYLEMVFKLLVGMLAIL